MSNTSTGWWNKQMKSNISCLRHPALQEFFSNSLYWHPCKYPADKNSYHHLSIYILLPRYKLKSWTIMGAGQSGNVEIGGSSMGYQVLRVYPDSPGSRAGLKAYFDFIVAIGNTRFNKESGSLREILKASVDQKLKMVVFNTRAKTCRDVEIIPSTSWGGNGLLGVSIKHSSFDRADERVWHVIDVEPGSPAAQAGFKAGEDYVIGSDSILQENDDLYNLIEAHEGKALKLFVYNTSSDNCREIICHPNSRWGGKGFLGCEFGHGLLHRIPYGGEGGEPSDDPRGSLLRNEHQMAKSTEQVRQFKPNSFSNPLMRHQMNQLNLSQQQPGQHLFQQALSQANDKPSLHQQFSEQLSLPSNQPQHIVPPASSTPPTGPQHHITPASSAPLAGLQHQFAPASSTPPAGSQNQVTPAPMEGLHHQVAPAFSAPPSELQHQVAPTSSTPPADPQQQLPSTWSALSTGPQHQVPLDWSGPVTQPQQQLPPAWLAPSMVTQHQVQPAWSGPSAGPQQQQPPTQTQIQPEQNPTPHQEHQFHQQSLAAPPVQAQTQPVHNQAPNPEQQFQQLCMQPPLAQTQIQPGQNQTSYLEHQFQQSSIAPPSQQLPPQYQQMTPPPPPQAQQQPQFSQLQFFQSSSSPLSRASSS